MTELETFEVILEHPVLYMYVYMETGEVLFRYGSNPKSYLLLLPLAPALPSSFPHCVPSSVPAPPAVWSRIPISSGHGTDKINKEI